MSFPYTFSFQLPNAAVAPSEAVLPRGARAAQFSRGIKFANVPGGRSDMVFHPGSGRVAHVNTVETVLNGPLGIEMSGNYSGAIKFRFRSYKEFPIPEKIRG